MKEGLRLADATKAFGCPRFLIKGLGRDSNGIAVAIRKIKGKKKRQL